jgi:hypothetical protein
VTLQAGTKTQVAFTGLFADVDIIADTIADTIANKLAVPRGVSLS